MIFKIFWKNVLIIVFCLGWATHKIPMEANKRNPGKPIQIKTYQTAVGLDIDCMEGRVYWSDISLNAIRSSLYNGSDKNDFITG